MATLAETIIAALHARGTRHMFGVPGGGSSLDLIEAARIVGIEFILSGSETSGAFMAAVTAELTGAPGAILAGVGPGAAAAVNGIAYAGLECAPVVMLTDCKDRPPEDGGSLHQSFDQAAMFRPITKAATRLRPSDGHAAVEALLDLAMAPPLGPVHVDMSTRDASQSMAEGGVGLAIPSPAPRPGAETVSAVRSLLAKSRRPVILAGLEARGEAAARSLAELATALGAAVMTTYKAKGVLPDGDERLIGPFTGAAAEAACVGQADLIILYGFDPIEMVPLPWTYTAPLVEVSAAPNYRQPAEPAARLIGPLAESVAALDLDAPADGWPTADLGRVKNGMREALTVDGAGTTMDAVVDAIAVTSPDGTRLTVDAGAHMFSVFQRWPASSPFGVMKSNGLSTMGFALPAAIGSALAEPETPVCAVTGDGGMMMCLAELATAARLELPLVVVVANDAALSLIDIKQQRQQRPSVGVRYPRVDFAQAARGLGARGYRVDAPDKIEAVLRQAFREPGPSVVDIALDPAGYGGQLEALRG